MTSVLEYVRKKLCIINGHRVDPVDGELVQPISYWQTFGGANDTDLAVESVRQAMRGPWGYVAVGTRKHPELSCRLVPCAKSAQVS